MEIRPLRETDYVEAEQILDQVGEEEAARLDPVFFHHLGGYVARNDDNELIGYLLGFRSDQDPDVAFVHLVVVRPDYRGKKVATRLMDRFEQQARSWECRWLEAMVDEANEGGRRFHEARDFDAKPAPPDWAVEGRPVLKMRKRLRYVL